VEVTAGLSGSGVGGVEGEEGAAGSTGGGQELPSPEGQLLGKQRGGFMSEPPRRAVGARERNGHEFAVRGAVQLNRKTFAFWVDHGASWAKGYARLVKELPTVKESVSGRHGYLNSR